MSFESILGILAGMLLYGGAILQGQAPPSHPKSDVLRPLAVGLDATHSRPFPPDFYGANSGYRRNTFNWADPAFRKALQGLGFVSVLRFPAGTLANYWDWKTGTLIRNYKYKDGTGPFRNAYPSPLGELAAEAGVMHARALFVLNMLTDPTCAPPVEGYCAFTPESPNLTYQLELLEAARKIGLDLPYVELGNEYYVSETAGYASVYPDPSGSAAPLASVVYGRLASKWISAIRQRYPKVQIAAVGAHITRPPGNAPRRAKWLSGLFDPALNSTAVGGNGRAALQGADAVTLHVYPAANLPRGTAINRITAEDMLGQPFKLWAEVKANDLPLIPSNVSIWFTEYNLGGKTVPAHGTWAHGLYMATLSLLYLEDGRVRMAVHHDIVDNALHGDLYSSTHAFAESNGWAVPATPPATAQWGQSATADALNVIGAAAAGASHAVRLTFAGVPTIRDRARSIAYPALYGWDFTGRSTNRLLILNLFNKALPVSLTAFGARASYRQLYGDPGTFVTGGMEGSPSNLIKKTGLVQDTSALTLPAFSITVVQVGSTAEPAAAAAPSHRPAVSCHRKIYGD
ncbi:MAG: hypothetical protein M1436_04970 [Acidobacteria bacterium]|nr:hypothetical protein [Acidobacteriota bacterium]